MTASGRSRVMTEPLGGSPLSLAIQTRRLPDGVQPRWPAHPDEWKEHVDRVRRGTSGTAMWLETLQPAIAPMAGGVAARRLHRVVAERGVVVTTGQQAGLFGGPLYTLAKALTALGLADLIEEHLGVPAAPVFWAATDDADFLEASVAHVADATGLHVLRLSVKPPAGTPMALAPLGDTRSLREELRQSCGSAANPTFLELALSAFGGQDTVGNAYVRLLRGLLEPLGIAVMDSSHEAYRGAAQPFLRESLQRAGEISRALSDNAGAIRAVGFEPQVQDDRGLSLVFSNDRGVKRRLSVLEAAQFARSNDALSPNVLLRPLVERELIPTVAYVAGPGELAYFAQTNAVAAALDRDPPVGVPRWSCTIVEPFADRALRRLGVEWHELKDLHALERRLASASLPAGVAAAWQRLQSQIHASLRELRSAVNDSALMPLEVIEGLDRSLAHRLSRGERRLVAAAKRRNARVRQDLAVASAALFPLGSRQERVLNFIPMLTRGGEELLDEMRRAASTHANALLAAERTVPVVAR